MLKDAQMRDLIRHAITALAIVLIAFLLFSFIKTIFASVRRKQQEDALAMAVAGGMVDYVTGEDGEIMDLNAKGEGVEQLEKFIDKDPQAVAQLLRNWLSDDR